MIYQFKKGKLVEQFTEEEFHEQHGQETLYTTGAFTEGFISAEKLTSILRSGSSFNKNKELLEIKRDLRNKEQEYETLQGDYELFQVRTREQLSEKDVEITSLKSSIRVFETDTDGLKKQNNEYEDRLKRIREMIQTVEEQLN